MWIITAIKFHENYVNIIETMAPCFSVCWMHIDYKNTRCQNLQWKRMPAILSSWSQSHNHIWLTGPHYDWRRNLSRIRKAKWLTETCREYNWRRRLRCRLLRWKYAVAAGREVRGGQHFEGQPLGMASCNHRRQRRTGHRGQDPQYLTTRDPSICWTPS